MTVKKQNKKNTNKKTSFNLTFYEKSIDFTKLVGPVGVLEQALSKTRKPGSS